MRHIGEHDFGIGGGGRCVRCGRTREAIEDRQLQCIPGRSPGPPSRDDVDGDGPPRRRP